MLQNMLSQWLHLSHQFPVDVGPELHAGISRLCIHKIVHKFFAGCLVGPPGLLLVSIVSVHIQGISCSSCSVVQFNFSLMFHLLWC